MIFFKKKEERWWVVKRRWIYMAPGETVSYFEPIKSRLKPKEAIDGGPYVYISGPFNKGEAIIEAKRMNDTRSREKKVRYL